MSPADIVLERETANDESAVVALVHVASGVLVAEDQLLFELENSKAVQELRAPVAGVLIHSLEVGLSVLFGVPIARIVSEAAYAAGAKPPPLSASEDAHPPAVPETLAAPAAAAEAPPAPLPSPVAQAAQAAQAAPASAEPAAAQRPETPEPLRFSRSAATLMQSLGVSATAFTSGFVTSKDVRVLAGAASPPESQAGGAPAAGPVASPHADKVAATPLRHAGEGRPVGASKRVEIETLSAGAGETMLSVLGVDLGPVEAPRQPGALMAGKISDLVIYEASRLMKTYPRLNAYYAEGKVYLHPEVHAGFAIDGGGRLVVYGVKNADQLDLPALNAVMAEAVERYVSQTLTAAEMSRATFTVTDLSGSALDFVLPLLPRGQSCILGITKSPRSGFRLFAGFDHRVTEGGEVGLFLQDLSERIRSFSKAAGSGPAEAASCLYCGRTPEEAVGVYRERGLLKIIDRRGEDALCCASCWNGW